MSNLRVCSEITGSPSFDKPTTGTERPTQRKSPTAASSPTVTSRIALRVAPFGTFIRRICRKRHRNEIAHRVHTSEQRPCGSSADERVDVSTEGEASALVLGRSDPLPLQPKAVLPVAELAPPAVRGLRPQDCANPPDRDCRGSLEPDGRRPNGGG